MIYEYKDLGKEIMKSKVPPFLYFVAIQFDWVYLIYNLVNKKYYTYISLLCYFIEMKDDDYIAIASPDKVEKLNKAEFAEYLENYWKQVKI